MKKFAIKVVSLAMVLMVCFSMLVSVPVAANGLEWLDDIWGAGAGGFDLSGAFFTVFDSIINDPKTWEQFNQDRIDAGFPEFQVFKNFYTGASGGGSSGVRGVTVYPDGNGGYSPSGGGSSGVRGVELSSYSGGSTVQMPIVSRSYNTTTNSYNYNLNMPTYNYNDITNNYYETYNIQNIFYNQQYNTYNFEVTNNYYETNNYYLTYSPTYVNITYLDSASGSTNSSFYFYELPDGRNSFDLTADEVFGMYFLYDAVNYDMVVEADETLALYHFDGDLKDDSAYSGSASYVSGASHNYVEHGGFNSALYWDGNTHDLQFNLNEGLPNSGTLEYQLYLAQPSKINLDFDSSMYTHSVTTSGEYGIDGRPDYDWFGLSALDGIRSSLKYATEWEYPYHSVSFLKARTCYYDCYIPMFSFIQYNGKSLVDISYHYEVEIFWHYLYTNSERTEFRGMYQDFKSFKEKGLKVTGNLDSVLSYGSWVHIAIEWDSDNATLYYNGLPLDIDISSADIIGQNKFNISKTRFYNNYWYIDELRVSSGKLYNGAYTPQSHPFDTNKVMVLPETGSNGEIAVKSNLPVGTMRVGGARPTYPTVGDVFVNVEKSHGKHLVDSVQQYQAGGWVSVDAVIRENDKWVTLNKYDLKTYTVEPNPGDDGDDSSSSSNSGGTNPDDDDEGFLSWLGGVLGDFISSVIGFLVKIIKQLVEGVVTIITSLFDFLWSLVEFGANFGAFLGEAFGFIPPEIISVIVVGLSLSVILMIVKFLRG